MNRYQVVLSAEDGEYVISEHRTPERAIVDLESRQDNYGEGQELFIREVAR